MLMATTLAAQEQKVSIDVKQAGISLVFQQIKEQTELNFMYNAEQLAPLSPVTLRLQNVTVDSALTALFSVHPFEWRYDDNYIVIKQKETPRLAQSVTVKGFVYDEKRQPMPGVTVQVVGTSVGTATTANGWFSIDLPMLKGQLEFSFVGYKSKTVNFTAETAADTLRVYMEESVEELDEAVVVAYGETTRRESTGAISVVKADEWRGIPSSNIANLLQGRVAGMDITNISGAPGGGDVAITIRGYNSLDVEQGRRFSNPLWVVDGVPINSFTSPITSNNLLSDINPDMIESIQILKDASSAAIYGSRAANGVIIVTTKKGKKNQKATFSVNVSQSWSVLPRLSPITTGRGERLLRLTVDKNKFSAYLDPETNRWKYPTTLREMYDYKDYNASMDGFFIPDPRGDVSNGNMYQDSLNSFYNNSTNFFPIYYEKGKITNANIQSYGGSERMSYGIGLGYYDESGILKGTGYRRVDLNSSMNVTPVDRFNVDLRLNASIGTLKRGTSDGTFSTTPSIETVPGEPLSLSSLYPGEGSVVWDNILEAYEGTKETNRSVRLRTNFRLAYDIIDGLNLSTSLAADYAINRRNYFQPSYLDEDGFSISVGETAINLMVLNEDIVSYRRTFREDHNLNVMAGFSYEYNQMEYNGGSAENSPSDKIYYAPSGMPDLGYVDQWGTEVAVAFQHYESDMTEKKLISFFGRAEYNYKQKYLLTASIRWDGSSVFGKDCRWGTFPSVAAGWTFSEERLLKENVGWLSFGKLRASWGRSGKQFEGQYLALGLM